MDIKFECVGLWYAGEVAAVVDDQFGFSPEVSAAEGEVVVHPRPRALSKEESAWLQEYLKAHPQKSGAERELERVQAEELRREAIAARIAKVTEATGVTLKAADVRDALRAVAEVWIANDAK